MYDLPELPNFPSNTPKHGINYFLLEHVAPYRLVCKHGRPFASIYNTQPQFSIHIGVLKNAYYIWECKVRGETS